MIYVTIRAIKGIYRVLQQIMYHNVGRSMLTIANSAHRYDTRLYLRSHPLSPSRRVAAPGAHA